MTILRNHMLTSQFTNSCKTSSPIRSNYWGQYMKPTQTRHKENLSNPTRVIHLRAKTNMASRNIPIFKYERYIFTHVCCVFFHLSCYTPKKGNMSTKQTHDFSIHLNRPTIQFFRWTFPGWWFQPIWNIFVKMGSSPPRFGMKIPKHVWVAPSMAFPLLILGMVSSHPFLGNSLLWG